MPRTGTMTTAAMCGTSSSSRLPYDPTSMCVGTIPEIEGPQRGVHTKVLLNKVDGVATCPCLHLLHGSRSTGRWKMHSSHYLFDAHREKLKSLSASIVLEESRFVTLPSANRRRAPAELRFATRIHPRTSKFSAPTHARAPVPPSRSASGLASGCDGCGVDNHTGKTELSAGRALLLPIVSPNSGHS